MKFHSPSPYWQVIEENNGKFTPTYRTDTSTPYYRYFSTKASRECGTYEDAIEYLESHAPKPEYRRERNMARRNYR